jgi:hypothetical protein
VNRRDYGFTTSTSEVPLIPNPIQKVLSTMAARQVQALLMGGQACVFYGAAEFSRDADLILLAEPDNLSRLSGALAELKADCIAVPPFRLEFLQRGHAIHFRCHHPDVFGIRIDVMSVLRGVAPFPQLWERRTTVEDVLGARYELLSLPDLVQAKKTQRSKDWPMLRRLVEAHYLQHRAVPRPGHPEFWARELRTPEFLIEAVAHHSEPAGQLAERRPLLKLALANDRPGLEHALGEEERIEREQDRVHWQPLKTELETLRRQVLAKPPG